MIQFESQTFVFESALVETPTGQTQWRDHVRITIADQQIVEISPDAKRSGSPVIRGTAIPAMVNVHSHAFQRGFAGLSEYRTAANDSFWTWRNLMYEFVGKLSPEDVFVIARQLYLEMIVAGYSWVGEFHYLHNDLGGNAYANPAEMADAVLRAANETGIGICLIPVLYQRNGFGSDQVSDGQKRFSLATDDFFRLLESCQSKTKADDNSALAMAIHSLRAVDKEPIDAALNFRNSFQPDLPVHIHVAEQTQEVDDCLAATGKRSAEYLLSEFDVDSRWCLIHATHLDRSEIQKLAASKATVGLCPTTEANLGDGIFAANDFLTDGGSISIGSDSHCSVDMQEEIRLLEYGQRLSERKRAVLGTALDSVGRRLYSSCAIGGGQAIGVSTGRIAVGCRADIIVLDDGHQTIAGAKGDRLLDRFVFSNQGNPICKRMIGGRWIEENELRSKLDASTREFCELNRRFFG